MSRRKTPLGAQSNGIEEMSPRQDTLTKQWETAESKAGLEIASIEEVKMEVEELPMETAQKTEAEEVAAAIDVSEEQEKLNEKEVSIAERPKLRARRVLPVGFEEELETDEEMEVVQTVRVDDELEDDVFQVEKIEGLSDVEPMTDEEFERELTAFRSGMSGTEELPQYTSDAGSTVLATSNLERDIRQDLSKYNGQECYICHSLDGEMQTCTEPKCLSRFHPECNDPDLLGEFEPYVRPSDTLCRQHHCTTCFAENLRCTAFRSLPDEEIFRCVYCTNAYHKDCVPAGCPMDGQKIPCNQHYRRSTVSYPHIPFCFGCRKEFDKEKDHPNECHRCLRAFHDECAQVNMRMTSVENVCFYCLNNWSPRKGQLVHVFDEDGFAPGEVACTDWEEAINIKGLVPVFLIGCKKRDSSTLLQIPACFLVPMIAYEPMLHYYEENIEDGAILTRYSELLKLIEEDPFYLLPRPKSQKPRYNDEMSNTMTLGIRRDLKENYDEVAEECRCEEDADGLKCYTDACLNRHLGYECRDSCGEGCMNGPNARNVPDTVEIFEAPFGGFGLRAKEVIKEGYPIGEYTGSVITKEKMIALLNNYVTRRNQEQPLYFMCIDGAFNIDAAKNGRATRFANHSCDPNTKVSRVLGTDNLPHVMLYAKQQIEVDEPITFDYNFTWVGFNPRCYCGTDACSGHFSGRLKKKMRVGPKPAIKPEPKQEPKRESQEEGGSEEGAAPPKPAAARRRRQRKNKEDPDYRVQQSQRLLAPTS